MSLPPGGGGGGRKGSAEDRIKKYKAGVDVDDACRRREEELVGIRKTKRGDSLARKRRGVSASRSTKNCASPASDGVHALAADRHPSACDACLRTAAGPPSRFGHVNFVIDNPHVVMLCLKALGDILNVGKAQIDLGNRDGINLYAQEVEDCEDLDKIENLQSHDNININEKAIDVLEKYWDEEE